MSWDACLEELMGDTITVATVTAGSASALYGVPSYTTSVTTLKAHYTKDHRETRDNQGNTVAQSGTVWLAGSTTTVEVTAKITLPDGTSPPIISVTHYSDGDGLYGQRLALGF